MDNKTVAIQREQVAQRDPLSSLRKESTERMKAALLACSLDDPKSAASAIQQVTILRVSHQVARIVQFLDMMDKIEDKLYESLDATILSADVYDSSTFKQLLVIQEQLQKTIIESNKLLQPYLNMEQYPVFENVVEEIQVDASVLELTTTKRNALRENAGAILAELEDLTKEKSEAVEA